VVERLKEAIEKARSRRQGVETAVAPRAAPAPAPAPGAFEVAALAELPTDDEALRRERIVAFEKSDPAYVPFDLLRTRLLAVCRRNGWTRVGVTSPTKGSGKSTICANLGFSLARQSEVRTVLLDMDLRAPRLSRLFHADAPPSMVDFLTGRIPMEQFFVRIERNFILGLNDRPVRDSSEILQSGDSAARLEDALKSLAPDIAIYDLPPILGGDDVIGFLPNIDCLLMVVNSGVTRPADFEEAERLITGSTEFLGVLLNRYGDDATEANYYYA
jgi:Mrp family chromosome partitioning ATPase